MLLYLPHTCPHFPFLACKCSDGKGATGRYGDSVEEIDWSTGQILNALKKHGLEKNTLVIFTSDNGSNGRNGGSNAPLSGSKGSTMEGGMRVPMIARWPGRIPADSKCSACSVYTSDAAEDRLCVEPGGPRNIKNITLCVSTVLTLRN